MLRSIIILICMLAGLWCLLALADAQDWTRPVWDRLMPQVLLPRRLSPTEMQMAQAESRIAEFTRDVAVTTRGRDEIARGRCELLAQLCKQAATVMTGNRHNFLSAAPRRIYRAAMYGEAAGFNLKGRPDEFTVVCELPCWKGDQFDSSIERFVAPEIDVIFIGGDNTFEQGTARAIEQAVHDDGKVLVINFWSQRNFEASLPAVNRGNAPYGSHLIVAAPQHPAMAGLPNRFVRQGRDLNREKCSAREGSTVLLRYKDGTPALLYWRYGKGYVVEWTLENIAAFLPGDTADTINYRLLQMLLAETNRGQSLPPDSYPSSGLISSEKATDIEQSLQDNPVIAALVRSINAEDRRDKQLANKLADLRAQLERMGARLIALRSGASLAEADEPARPSDSLRLQETGPACERYERILREALRSCGLSERAP